MFALEGIRVLDLAQHTAGPSTSMYLADQGAEVIKVEPRATGDHTRTANTTPFLGTNAVSFITMNRNKKSLTLDIRKPAARPILQGLVKQSDVIVHNFRPAAAKKYGLDYETLSELNPRIVWASVTAFGS